MAAVGTTKRASGADGVTVTLLTVAGFLLVLAMLAWQVRSSTAASPAPRRVVVVRRVYETRVVETVVGGHGGGSSMTQSVLGSASESSPSPAPVTRAS